MRLFDHYKPIWMFWHAGSGFIGGLIMGAFICASIWLLCLVAT